MVEIFDEAVEQSSFGVKNKKANFLKQWWSEKIGFLYESKREALRTYNRSKTRTNFIALQKERAKLKREVRRTKRQHVRELTEKIDGSTPARQLWNLLKGIDTSIAGKHKKNIEMSREE